MTPNVTAPKPYIYAAFRLFVFAAILVVLNSSPAFAQIAQVNDKNFYSKVLDVSYRKPVIVMFTGKNCPPCKLLEPVLAEATAKYRNIATYKINESRSPRLSHHYNITGIPTTLAFYKAYADVLMKGYPGNEKVEQVVEQVYKKGKRVY